MDTERGDTRYVDANITLKGGGGGMVKESKEIKFIQGVNTIALSQSLESPSS